MKNLVKVAVAVVVVCASTGPIAADNRGGVPLQQSETMGQASGERAPGHFDPVAYAAEHKANATRLEAVEVGAGFDHPLVVTVTHDDLAAIERGVAEERRYRVGITKSVAAVVDLATVPPVGGSKTMILGWGAVRSQAGSTVWSGAISAPGATSLRVHIKELSLPAGSELWLYNRLGEAFGPYTKIGPNNSGEFWTHTVAGSEALLQVRHQGSIDGLKSVYFEIDEVGYLGDRFVPGVMRTATADAAKALCSFNEPCVENASCGGTDQAVNAVRDAVAYMLFRSGGFWYICSGGLLADTDTSSQIPYFLTANHCISREREADTLETTFFYTSACGQCDTSTTPATIGADIVSGSKTSDYTLLRLNQPAPPGAAFLGWNINPVAFADGAGLYRISHPAGAPQAYSEHTVDTSKGTCSSWPRGNWIYSRDVFGATEGGSSGSPVVNGAGQVVGQLSGGCGTDVYNTCNSTDNATVDGAFAAYYSKVAQWLDPATPSCNDSDGDGYNAASCGGTDCNDSNALINPGASETCGNGVDDDCDGAIDTADSDCSPTCQPVGQACSSNSECCSNQCRGRGGNKTCR